MYRFIRSLVALAGCLLIVVFAIANRHDVELFFTPLPVSFTVPVFVVFLLGMIAGALLGGFAAVLRGRRRRVEMRSLRRKVGDFEHREAVQKRAAEAAAMQRSRSGSTALATR